MNDGVQRWLSIVLGAGAIVLAAWISLSSSDRRTMPGPDASAPIAAGRDASAAPAPSPAATKEADTDAGLSLSLSFDASTVMPSGAPRSVRLGIVLVQWQGAEGASSAARAKPDALAHAEKLAAEARTDWKAAVREGDSGSSDDIGRIPRGVLGPPTEVAVFSLAPGEISGVLETPRGYWIVKRVE